MLSYARQHRLTSNNLLQEQGTAALCIYIQSIQEWLESSLLSLCPVTLLMDVHAHGF